MTDKRKEIIIKEILKAVKDRLDSNGLIESVFNILADIFYCDYKLDMHNIDIGNGISVYPQKTNKHFNSNDYKTMDDFLEEYTDCPSEDEMGIDDKITIKKYKIIVKEWIRHDIWSMVCDVFKKHLFNDSQASDIENDVLNALVENNLDEISILEKVISPYPFKKFIEKYDDSYADEVRRQRAEEEQAIYERITNNDKISALIYKDFLLFKDDVSQKYNSEDIELLKKIFIFLIRKYGRKNMEIFVESDYFKKSVSNSIFERFPLIIRTLK